MRYVTFVLSLCGDWGYSRAFRCVAAGLLWCGQEHRLKSGRFAALQDSCSSNKWKTRFWNRFVEISKSFTSGRKFKFESNGTMLLSTVVVSSKAAKCCLTTVFDIPKYKHQMKLEIIIFILNFKFWDLQILKPEILDTALGTSFHSIFVGFRKKYKIKI